MSQSEEMGREPGGPGIQQRAGGWAWGLCWLMFACTVLNYMDRQAVAVVGERITTEFKVSFEDFGWVIAAFQVSYALFQVPAGYLADRWNVRWTYAGAVAWWSLAAIAVALAPTLGLLMVARAILGMGESFNWPCALKVTSMALPPADRSLGNGIFNSGAAVGAVVTPLVVTPLTVMFGWRVAFMVIGAMGFVWVAVWLLSTGGRHRGLWERQRLEGESGRKPVAPVAMEGVGGRTGGGGGGNDVLLGYGGLAVASVLVVLLGWGRMGLTSVWLAVALLMVGLLLVSRVLPMSSLSGRDWTRSLGEIVRQRRFWVLVVVSVSVNVSWHFLVNWLPTYLKTDRGMAFVAGSLLSAIPFLAADAGNLGGGWLSRLVSRRRGLTPARGRLVVMIGCVLLISSGAWVGVARGNVLTLLLLGIMALGTAAFMANYFAFCQEVDARHTGLIVGILGGLGNLFAAGFSPIAGRVKDTVGNFGPVFVVVGLLPILGILALGLGWGWRGRVEAEGR